MEAEGRMGKILLQEVSLRNCSSKFDPFLLSRISPVLGLMFPDFCGENAVGVCSGRDGVGSLEHWKQPEREDSAGRSRVPNTTFNLSSISGTRLFARDYCFASFYFLSLRICQLFLARQKTFIIFQRL
jgi:hypothetical protein